MRGVLGAYRRREVQLLFARDRRHVVDSGLPVNGLVLREPLLVRPLGGREASPSEGQRRGRERR